MAAPVFVTCAANAWTKVATNVTAGMAHQDSYAPNGYLQYSTPTGGAAPTLVTQGVPVFVASGDEPISAAAGVDVYLWAHAQEGRVRMDLP